MELLNSKLKEKVQIERFRPNIIVTDCPSHAEVSCHHTTSSDWQRLSFSFVKSWCKNALHCSCTIHRIIGQVYE